MHLPSAPDLPIKKLAACFNNTSATYKFYWLLSIIQEIEEGKMKIPKRNLFARMISNAWYTVNYFHVSFGKQDKIQEAIHFIKTLEQIEINNTSDFVNHTLVHSQNPETRSILNHFNSNVPHWFLSPWFPGQSKSDIYSNSKLYQNQCIYALYDESIIINQEWLSYIHHNTKILKDFCYWNLAIFLQNKNPNVPDIPGKLVKPGKRVSLTKQRKKYWDIIFRKLGTINCIYTEKPLTIDDYAVEHFIPYNFVSHDLIWNLIPADVSFNSAKSDKLPKLDKHFRKFYNLQQLAIKTIREVEPNNKFLEDYLTIFSDLDQITEESFKQRVQPLVTIASNNGFEFL